MIGVRQGMPPLQAPAPWPARPKPQAWLPQRFWALQRNGGHPPTRSRRRCRQRPRKQPSPPPPAQPPAVRPTRPEPPAHRCSADPPPRRRGPTFAPFQSWPRPAAAAAAGPGPAAGPPGSGRHRAHPPGGCRGPHRCRGQGCRLQASRPAPNPGTARCPSTFVCGASLSSPVAQILSPHPRPPHPAQTAPPPRPWGRSRRDPRPARGPW